MIKNASVYLYHISDCISKIKEYTKEMDEEKFLANSLIQDAVIRNFEIIGEATKQLDMDFREKYPEIEWKKMAGLRDKLIHGYIGVDLWAVWGFIERVIPELERDINNIIKLEQGQ